MSSLDFNFSEQVGSTLPDATQMRIGIVVSEWNNKITGALLDGALTELKKNGVKDLNITIKYVPGSFELVYGCAQLSRLGLVDAVIAIGSVIKGDTSHYDFVCNATSQGIMELNVSGKIPIIFGVLTTNNFEQAMDRADTKIGNKGKEFAITAIKMIDYAWSFKN